MGARPETRAAEPTLRASRSLAEAVDRVLKAGQEPLRAAFLARALNGLARLAPELEARALGEATGAPSDYAALVQALHEPPALRVLEPDDPLAAARLRGLLANEQLLRAEGGTLTAEHVAKLLGLTRQGVDKRRRAGRLIGLQVGRRGYAYPAWQFGPEGTLAGLEDILAHLDAETPLSRVDFFLSGTLYLDGETPLAELRRGQVEPVRRAARAYGEQGAP